MDRYDVQAINRDQLRKMLTQIRREEQRIYEILEVNSLTHGKFAADFRSRSKRKDLNTKLRVVNEYMRIKQNIENVGANAEKAIHADQVLSDWMLDRGMVSTAASRKAFGEFMDNYRASSVGKIADSESAFAFFEEFGESADAADFAKKFKEHLKESNARARRNRRG